MSKTPEQILKKWYTPLHGIGEIAEIEIIEAMKEYAQSKTQELQEQNAELVEILRHVVYEYEQGESSYRTIMEINELLTKYKKS